MRGSLLSQKHFFSDGIKKLVLRWKKCIEKQGDYVEKWCYYKFYIIIEIKFVSVVRIIVDSRISTCIFRNSGIRCNVFQRCSYIYHSFQALNLLSFLIYWYWQLISVEYNLINSCVKALLRLTAQQRSVKAKQTPRLLHDPTMHYSVIYIYWETVHDYVRMLCWSSHCSNSHVLTQMAAACSKLYSV